MIATAALSRQPSHPDAPRFDDREVASPIATRSYCARKLLPDIAGSRHGEAHQDYTAPCRQSRRLGKFTEILVKCEKNAFIAGGLRQDFSIGAARGDRPDPNNIVSGRIKSGTAAPGKLSLARKRISSGARIYPFSAEHVAS